MKYLLGTWSSKERNDRESNQVSPQHPVDSMILVLSVYQRYLYCTYIDSSGLNCFVWVGHVDSYRHAFFAHMCLMLGFPQDQHTYVRIFCHIVVHYVTIFRFWELISSSKRISYFGLNFSLVRICLNAKNLVHCIHSYEKLFLMRT